MTSQAENHSHEVVAIARKFAVARGYAEGDSVGSYILIGAIAKHLGKEAADAILLSAGVKDVAGLLAVVPESAPDGALPPLQPDKHLKEIILNKLSGFFKRGTMKAEDALKVLVAPENLTAQARQFLMHPLRGLCVVEGKKASIDTKAFLRSLSAFYQRRYHLGALYHRVTRKSGLSDFASGDSDQEYHKAVDDVYAEEAKAQQRLFGGSDYRRSPLASLRQRYGEDGSHILTAALLAEIGQVGDGPLSVRELAWVMDPKCFHRTLGTVRNQVRQLRMLGAVDLIPESEEGTRLYHRVLAADDVVDEFLQFLRDADRVTEADVDDCLKRSL